MGFFKKVGKLTKKINLRGVAKLANNFTSMIPFVGGLTQNLVGGAIDKGEQKHAEKEANKQLEMQRAAQAQYEASIANQNSYTGAVQARDNPNIGDILQGALGGALSGAGGVVAPSHTAGQVGGTLINSSVTEWLKQSWWKLLIGVTLLGSVIYMAVRGGSSRTRARR